MLETLLGGLFGGALRILPEVMKTFDRANERKHELAMQDKALEFERLRGDSRVLEYNAMQDVAHLDALKSAYESQRSTKIKWVDALNALVRPVTAFWYFGTYMAVKYIMVYLGIQEHAEVHQLLSIVWTEHDVAMLWGILNFWFVGRVYDRNK